MSVKCDLYAVRCPFYFFQMSVYVCVPRPKDARPPTEGRMSLDRRTHVLRPKDADLYEQYKESKTPFVNG